MNYHRRSVLAKISFTIGSLKVDVDNIAEQEQEAFDSMPEGIQESEKGEKMEENVSELEEIASELDSLMERIDELCN